MAFSKTLLFKFIADECHLQRLGLYTSEGWKGILQTVDVSKLNSVHAGMCSHIHNLRAAMVDGNHIRDHRA